MRTKVSKLIEVLSQYPPDAELESSHPTVDIYIKEKNKPIDLLIHLCTPRKYIRKSDPKTIIEEVAGTAPQPCKT